MRATLSALVLALLTALLPALSAEDFQGRLIFAIEILETSEGPASPERTGIFYYYKEAGASQFAQDSLTGYMLRNGEVIGISGGQEFLKQLKALPLTSFDVQKDIDSTMEKLRSDAARRQMSPPIFVVTDGAKYRILYDFNGVLIDYTRWNAGAYVNHYAQYSKNLRNLSDLIDLFALNYGRRQFGLLYDR